MPPNDHKKKPNENHENNVENNENNKNNVIDGENPPPQNENTPKPQEKERDNIPDDFYDGIGRMFSDPAEVGARDFVFEDKLKAFNRKYKSNVRAEDISGGVIKAWTLLTSDNQQKAAEGKKILSESFKETLKNVFDAEKNAAYTEHRLPEYAAIVKDANDLMRASMYAYTDLYHAPERTSLFSSTAFGGLNEKEIAELTVGESDWSLDQKSDEAWEIQSREAKNIAEQWLQGDKPYEKMIGEMNALVEANKNGIVDRRELLNKLTAAEWLLMNNSAMMVENPDDPLNPTPNWGNRYWRTLTETREALGIDKHTSMRDLIQSNYAAQAKAVGNRFYQARQIYDYVLDPKALPLNGFDSLENQKEEFAAKGASFTPTGDPQIDELQDEKKFTEIDAGGVRIRISIPELNQRTIMENEPKVFSNAVSLNIEVKLDNPTQAPKS